MPFTRPTLVQIDKKLRDDYRRQIKDSGAVVDAEDPILAILFRTFAAQLEALYSETENTIRYALLDDLISALGIEGRHARPAQMVLQFVLDRGAQLIEAGASLTLETPSRDKLTFTTDAALTVSAARISMAATYQNGHLQLVSGIDMPEKLAEAGSSVEPVRADLGKNPAILIAVENLPPGHLSQHAFFFEFSSDARALKTAMSTETWCLAGADGQFGGWGILRPFQINAGVRGLNWLLTEHSGGADKPLKKDPEVPTLREGFYRDRVFVLPVVPPSRQFVCSRPKGLEAALGKLFGTEEANIFETKRAWLRVSLPPDIPDLHASLVRITLNAVTSSNVECVNETLRFTNHGTSVSVGTDADFEETSLPIRDNYDPTRYLVSPLSIFGETGTVYFSEFQSCLDPGVGRYRIRNGQVQLKPAQHLDGQTDSYANLRLWVTRGERGNQAGIGKLQTALTLSGFPSVKVRNLTAASGGTNGEALQDARMRFAEALLSRDRIVTHADLICTLRAFDRRILKAEVSPKVQRTGHGLQRVQFIKLWFDREDFRDPEEEMRVLLEEVTSTLRERFIYDTELQVAVEWK